ARNVMIAGLITRSFSDKYSNPQADGSLQEYLEENNVTGISGVDTRKLVRHIRRKGVMNAVISSEIMNEDKLIEAARNWDSMEGLELARKVSRKEKEVFESDGPYKVAAIDYGIKNNIINNLNKRGCSHYIFPSKGNFEEELDALEPDGFFFSNGPGDPNATAEYALETVEYAKRSRKPVFGICLGHQLMALSERIPVKKMFVGHRGAN